MITIPQIKAARALLEWTQKDLAKKSGLSVAFIALLEQGKGSPRDNTWKALINCFENAGIEFTPDPGVRMRRDKFNLQVLEGHGSILELWQDIEDSCLLNNGEVLLSGVDERIWIEKYKKELKEMLHKRRNQNIKTRFLIAEGDQFITVPAERYRAIPKYLFQQTPYYVYADKVAIIKWDIPQTVLIIQNSLIAKTFRDQFNFNWSIGHKLDPSVCVIANLDA